jgi:hypothetical protein
LAMAAYNLIRMPRLSPKLPEAGARCWPSTRIIPLHLMLKRKYASHPDPTSTAC